MPTKILVLSANPKGTSKLQLDKEVRDIQEGLRQTQYREEFDFKASWAVRIKDIRRALLSYRPNIIHFSGHGVEDGHLYVENEQGSIQSICPDALAGLFKIFAEDIQCVLLNACYSEEQAKAIAQHIDHVIGMRKEIGDSAAVEFSTAFYEAIGEGCSIKKAYEIGRNAIHLAGLGGYTDTVLRIKKLLPNDNTKARVFNTDNVILSEDKEQRKAKRTRFEVVLKGSIEDLDSQTLEDLLDYLKTKIEDPTLTVKLVERGSIKIVFEGSEEGFSLLSRLRETGEFQELGGFSVQNVEKVKIDPESNSRVENISSSISQLRQIEEGSVGDQSSLRNSVALATESSVLDLQKFVGSSPPLFPWETEVTDYPTKSSDSISDIKISSLWLNHVQSLRISSLLPEEVLQVLFVRCTSMVRFPIKQSRKLIHAVEYLFPDQLDILEPIANMVLVPAYRSDRSTQDALINELATVVGSYDSALPEQHVALSMLAAQEIFESLMITISVDDPIVIRTWITSIGNVELTVRLSCKKRLLRKNMPQLNIKALLPSGGQIGIRSAELEKLARRSQSGTLEVSLDNPTAHKSHFLEVLLDSERYPLLIAIYYEVDTLTE